MTFQIYLVLFERTNLIALFRLLQTNFAPIGFHVEIFGFHTEFAEVAEVIEGFFT